jgi:hypothetical protein
MVRAGARNSVETWAETRDMSGTGAVGGATLGRALPPLFADVRLACVGQIGLRVK